MKKIVLILFPLIAFCNGLILPNQNLFITRYKSLEYIYSKDIKDISKVASFQSRIEEIYRKEFGFSLDDRLYVIINSNDNQLANGVSTQIPLNSQFLYMGGSSYIDYFCFDSWLKTLLIHETSHNFQLNPKENLVSNYAHKIFKNSPFSYIGIFPIFPIPNIMINPFLLEGNAVLNESRFKNGGRLYSGYALAELIELANANKIKPHLMYNVTLNFPYGEKNYLVGGFFQKFLAQRYGIERVNSYFKKYSTQIFPFFVNSSFREHFGKDFEKLLEEFVEDIKSRYREYRRVKGEVIKRSQLYSPLNRVDQKILFLVGNLRDYPTILSLDSRALKSVARGAFRAGRVFIIDNKYYTASIMQISPTKIKFGLFDSNGEVLEESIGKSWQGFLPDGRGVYFDISKSIERPKIYIEGEFYDSASSSVFIDKKGNLYYFKQQQDNRVLIKNKKEIFRYRGYYGFVVDVDTTLDLIYFIAPTNSGSGVYIFDGENIKRAINGDNIIDFKLIGKNRALVNSIEDSGYVYKIVKLEPFLDKIGEYRELAFSKSVDIDETINLESKKYRPIFNLKYSSLTQSFGYDSSKELFLNFKANFADPTTYNFATLSFFKDSKKRVGGIGYFNSESLIDFGGELFLADYNNREDEIGYRLDLSFLIAKRGYYSATLRAFFLKDYDSIQRPATLSLNLKDNRHFGVSKFASSLSSLNIFLTEDRDNFLYGLSYNRLFQFGYQNFFGFNLETIHSSKLDIEDKKGIELEDNLDLLSKSPIEIEVLNIKRKEYVKDITSFEVGLYKSFDTSLYAFSFPVSIERTTLYSKYKRFNIKNFKQTTFGIESDMVFFNNFVVPVRLEYVDTPYGKDNFLIRLISGVNF